ncbi:antitoxin VapB41 [soil metagenome]
MKTTLDLPDDLVREMKVRAAQDGRKLKDVAAEIFRRGLAPCAREASPGTHRVKLPLIECQKPARPEDALDPEQIADVLLGQEGAWSGDAARR